MIINLSKIDFGGIATGGKAKPEEVFDVQPTTAEQTITPTEGSVFSGGTVRPVTSSIDNNIRPENIKEGVSILGVVGTLSDIFVVPDGIKFAYSNFSEIPSNWDFSNVIDMSKMLYQCSNLTSIPQLNTSNVTNMGDMFYNCTNLTSIPLLNTSNVTNMLGMFNGCSGLTTIPQLDTSKVTNMRNMFTSCSSLTSIPLLNTSNVTNMLGMFRNCSNLTTIPQLNTSNVTNMGDMFYNCTNLTSIPLLNTSNVTNMSNMFAVCSKLTTIPQLDTSKVTNMSSMFAVCSKLTTIPQLDTSKVTNMSSMFSRCESLTTVEGIDFSGFTTNVSYLFGYTAFNMSGLTRFIVNGKINVSISDSRSIKALTAIDYDSVKSILAAADRTDNTKAKTLAFNRTMADQNGELAALVASCSTKGWTITGLTLN